MEKVKKNEDKLQNLQQVAMESFSVNSKSRKSMHQAKDNKLNQAPYLWFVQKRGQNISVSDPLLILRLYALLHDGDMTSVSEFKGWLWRFCNRHTIRQLSLQGEKLSSSEN